jgi:hypothetical protein
MKTSLLLLAVSLLLNHWCNAQSWRPFRAAECDAGINGLNGSLFLFGALQEAMPTARAHWHFPTNGSAVVADLPFENVGDVARVSNTRFVVSGWTPAVSSGQGAICLVDVSPDGAAIAVSAVQVFPDVDPVNVCWHPSLSLLVVHDLRTKNLVVAPYSGGTVLPPLSSFSFMIGHPGCPLLDEDQIEIEPKGVGFGVRMKRLRPSGSLALAGGTWSYQATPLEQDSAAWCMDNAWLQSHSQNMVVQGSGAGFTVPASFNLRFITGGNSVVAQGQQVSQVQPVSFPAPPEFYNYPGGAFQVEGSQIRSGPVFRPLVRYGSPQQSGSAMHIGRGFVECEAVYVGSPKFQVDGPLNVASIGPTGSGTPFTYNAYLAIGFGLRGPGAPPDPVVVSGNAAYLTPALTLELAGQVQRFDLGGAAASLAVPSDPGLEGIIVLFQWYIQSAAAPQEVAVSDVFATRIWPAPGNLSQQGGASGGSGAAPGGGGLGGSQSASAGGPSIGGGVALTGTQQAEALFRPAIEQRNAPGSGARFQAVRVLTAQ